MANRITNGLKEITRWKRFFEELVQQEVFSRDTLQSRAFRIEELKQYNLLLSSSRVDFHRMNGSKRGSLSNAGRKK